MISASEPSEISESYTESRRAVQHACEKARQTASESETNTKYLPNLDWSNKPYVTTSEISFLLNPLHSNPSHTYQPYILLTLHLINLNNC